MSYPRNRIIALYLTLLICTYGFIAGDPGHLDMLTNQTTLNIHFTEN